jgi:hypothetical protein
MLPGYDRRWIAGLANAFLIRSPERVLASYARKWSDVSLRAIGFVEQAEIFDLVADSLGAAPPVIDAEDVLANPRTILTSLCTGLGVTFDLAMLSWPKGPKPFDGVWAPHWYNAVWNSTGFSRPEMAARDALPAPLARIADEARPYYEKLRAHRIAPAG